MKIALDIPKEFEEHFNNNRFEDSLHRLSADAHLMAGNYEQETAKMLFIALKNAKEVVRCKDCKYSHMTYDGDCKYCDNIMEMTDDGDGGCGYSLYLPGDWFCACGERKEVDAE